MEGQKNRASWGSNIGFLMAAIGSAVGLGNIWGFPYKMGEKGGFAFLLVYIILSLLVGFAIMISELAMGRKTGLGVIGTYYTLSKRFKWVGWLSVFAPFIIMSFYSTLGGYCLQYFFLNLADFGFGIVNVTGEQAFEGMLNNPIGCALFTFMFILICYYIVRGGIQGGIEKFNTIGMPALFILLFVIIIRSITLDGASEGLKFMFKPDFSQFSTLQGTLSVLSAAGGQMFFSLSLAMGPIITYGSYLSKKENLVKNSLVILIADTIVAIMAGLAVLPASFALGGSSASLSGPKLLFVTLQDVFASMGKLGGLFGVLFYGLVIIAAVSSAISLMEVLVTFFMDKAQMKGKQGNRSKILIFISLAILAEALIVSFDGMGSNGLWIPFKNLPGTFNDNWLSFMSMLSEGIAMPLAAFLMSIMVGWELKPKTIKDEVCQKDNKFYGYGFFSFCIKFIVPVAMLFILIGQISDAFGLSWLN